jgi:ElaB/YqjD/DUF883 family membrane-anchored ribosome-binding protein
MSNQTQNERIMNSQLRTDKLVQDLKNVVADAEDLMKATAGEVSEKAKEARDRLASALASARSSCSRIEEQAVAGAKVADRAVRDHPYESIGVAFGIGMIIGVLLGRK